jgi:nucleoside-diphosphate-sugar epimerase
MLHSSRIRNFHRQAKFNPKMNCSEGKKTMAKNARILVTGAGGFIGHHLVKRLRAEGNWVRGVDIKAPEYEATEANEFEILDLRRFGETLLAVAAKV